MKSVPKVLVCHVFWYLITVAEVLNTRTMKSRVRIPLG